MTESKIFWDVVAQLGGPFTVCARVVVEGIIATPALNYHPVSQPIPMVASVIDGTICVSDYSIKSDINLAYDGILYGFTDSAPFSHTAFSRVVISSSDTLRVTHDSGKIVSFADVALYHHELEKQGLIRPNYEMEEEAILNLYDILDEFS